MQRHRCTKCRNPIRNLAVARPGTAAEEWYHPDCWSDLCRTEQQRYEQQVRDGGLSALLAPYFYPRPANAPASATASAAATASASAVPSSSVEQSQA